MKTKYWTANKPQDIINERRKQLDRLLRFVNSKPEITEIPDLIFLNFIYASFIDLKINHSLVEDLDKHVWSDAIRNRRNILIQLRNHLCNRLDSIIEATKGNQDTIIIKFCCNMRLSINCVNDTFDQNFITIDNSNHVLTIKEEKLKIDKQLFNIISDLNLIPARFRKCAKHGCGTYFYQATARKKSYCCQRCAGAVRQRRFVTSN